MESYIRFIISRRRLVLLLIGLITAVSGWQMSQGVIASSMANFLGKSERYDEYLRLTREFVNDEVILIGWEQPDLLSRASLDRIEAVADEIGKMPDVRRVHSIVSLPRFEIENGRLFLDSYADEAREHPERAKEILEKLISDPLAGGALVSPDGRHTAIIVEMTPNDVRVPETYPKFLSDIRRIFKEHELDPASLHFTGMIAVLAEIMNQTKLNLSRLFPIVCAVLLLTVFVMFRRLWPMVITGIVALIGVIWTMGFAVLLFHKINVLMAMTPMFIMIVAFSDVIHLCSSYLLELSAGQSKDEAIVRAGSEVGQACLFTSLTTFFGFASLVVMPVPISRELGVVLGFGVAISLLIALTLTPVLFAVMPEPKPWRVGAASRTQDLLDGFLAWAARTVRRPGPAWAIVAVAALAVLVSIVGATRFEFETDFTKRMAKDNPLSRDERYFHEHFSGTSFIQVLVTTPEDDGLIEPETFESIARYQRKLVEIEYIDKAASLVDVMRTMHRQFDPEAASINPLPADHIALARYYLFLTDMASENGALGAVDDYGRSMIISLRLTNHGFFATRRVGDKALDLAKEILGDRATVKVISLNYLLGKEFNDIVLTGEYKAMAVAFITILIMMVIAVRSLTAGLWSMVPNVLPLLLLAGWLGWVWGKVDTDVIIVLMVALGIGVDDTIHFLMRFRIELAKSGDWANAMDKTFHYSGRAIVITSIILVLGFLPFAISDYLTTHMMGTLLPGVLLAALAADLFLAPAMITLGLFRFKKRERVTGNG